VLKRVPATARWRSQGAREPGAARSATGEERRPVPGIRVARARRERSPSRRWEGDKCEEVKKRKGRFRHGTVETGRFFIAVTVTSYIVY
jgi:hypothetical protein